MKIKNESVALLLDRIDNYAHLITLKSSLIIPANILLLDALIGGRDGSDPGFFLQAPLLLVALIGVVISLFFASLATFAFLGGSHTGDSYESLVFFGAICRYESDEFVKRFRDTDADSLEEDILKQAHLLSGSLLRKFKYVNFSIVFLLGSVLTFVVAKLV
jgi:hypothetical protein